MQRLAACRIAMMLALVAVLISTSFAQSGPKVVHGLQVPAVGQPGSFAPGRPLPNGDHFDLKDKAKFKLVIKNGTATVFPVNGDTFGAGIGLEDFLNQSLMDQSEGLKVSGTDSFAELVALCQDQHWDLDFDIASTGGPATAELLLRLPNGTFKFIANFNIDDNGATLGDIGSGAEVYRELFAASGALAPGAFFRFDKPAAAAGRKTSITISLPHLMDLGQLVVRVKRVGNQPGSTSFVWKEIVTVRQKVDGDENRKELGLLGRVDGGYPTGKPANAVCESVPCVMPPPIDQPSDVQVCPVCAVPFWVGRYSITQFARSNSQLVAELLSRDKATNTASDQLLAHLLSFEQMLRLANCNAGIQNTPFDSWPIDCQLSGYTVGRLIRESMLAIWNQDNVESARLLPAMQAMVKKTKFN